jgi:hypothetical protein
MKPGDDAKAIARRLTLEIYWRLRGENVGSKNLNRPLNYSRHGVA